MVIWLWDAYVIYNEILYKYLYYFIYFIFNKYKMYIFYILYSLNLLFKILILMIFLYLQSVYYDYKSKFI